MFEWEQLGREAITVAWGHDYYVREWYWGRSARILLTVHSIDSLTDVVEFAGGSNREQAWRNLLARTAAGDQGYITTVDAARMLGIAQGRITHWMSEKRLKYALAHGTRRAGIVKYNNLWDAIKADKRLRWQNCHGSLWPLRPTLTTTTRTRL